MVHFLMRYLWVLVAVIGQAAAWRFGDLWWGITGSVLLLLLAMFQSHRLEQGWRTHQIICYLGATALCLIAAFTDWFPCSAGCSKGEIYTLLFGINTLWLAAGAYGLLSLILILQRAPFPNFINNALCWLIFGNTLYFLGLSAWLQMICPLCLAVHSCILAATIFIWPLRGPTLLCIMWTLLGAGLVGGLFALEHRTGRPTEQVIIPQPHNPDNPFLQMPQYHDGKLDQACIDRINANRSIGSNDAAYTLSVFIRLGCNHCASWVPQIIRDGRILAADTPVVIKFHYIINQFSAENIDRHYLALSAAYDHKFLLAQTALLGNEADAIGYDESLAEFDLDAGALRQRIREHRHEFDALRQQDATLFEQADSNSVTPVFLLFHKGRLLQQWDSQHLWALIQEQVREHSTAEQE
jgi:hypothetical protein